ncbi:MAG: site-specific DNA-methyltransferase [Candidatus Binataceae bacterium]
MAKSKNSGKASKTAKTYRHPEAESPLRPDVGTQAQFKKRKPPVTYRYDSSLSPALDWDGQNHAREAGEALIREILEATSRTAAATRKPFDEARLKALRTAADEAQSAAERLKALSKPFLNWAGKAERLSFEVPTLPLFVHERLSTKGIIETLKGHKLDPQMGFDLFGDPGRSITDQVLKAYEYRDKWVNRMILGDSLAVMNSLLHYEGLGGQVQMIYIDPPYGVKFGSNFQPFVRKRDVSHNDDDDMTREPEMVKAYRDTWELGLHSYLSYLRDRLLLARELLTPSGSVFVQIGDENLHHVRELADEVFGPENQIAQITFVKTSGSTGDYLPSTCDYLLFYARDRDRLKYHQLFADKEPGGKGGSGYTRLQLADTTRRGMTTAERAGLEPVPEGAHIYCLDNLTSQSIGREKGEGAASWFPVAIGGKEFRPNMRSRWKTNEDGMRRLLEANRIEPSGSRLGYVRYLSDFTLFPISDVWGDVMPSFMSDKAYVVQTSTSVIARCLLATTDPGDLVLDPTCGSGTTAYVAEQWGRRWITIDTSRVPLALARQRLLTATFPYYQLKDEGRGPAGGFVYVRKQNQKGEEVGGIVPHITLKSIANDEPPDQEVLVDRPEVTNGITRVTGPFCVEATIPTPVDYDTGTSAEVGADGGEDYGSFVDRMLEVLRKSPILQVGGGKKITLKNVRPPAKTLALSAEAIVANGADRNVAFVFGPENGAVSEKLVHDAAFEAHGKGYSHLYVIGFAIQPNARNLIDNCDAVMSIAATYVQATPDLMMGDLLKTMRSSQIFSVCGLPEVKLRPIKANGKPKGNGTTQYEVELAGLDVFDPIEMHAHHESGDNVPAWLLDTDYNGLCFHVSQAFFPRTSAWDNLKKALRGTYDEAVWDHLAGTISAPFEAGEHGQIAVKVIDDRGNELMVVKNLIQGG